MSHSQYRLACLLLALPSAFFAPAQETVLLRYRSGTGERWQVQAVQQIRGTVQTHDGPSLPWLVDMTTGMDCRCTSALAQQAQLACALSTLTFSGIAGQTATDLSLDRTTLAAAGLVNGELTLTLTSTGPQTIPGNLSSDDPVQQMESSLLHAMPVLPGDPVSVGSQWEHTVTDTQRADAGRQTVYTLRAIERDHGRTLARIHFDTRLDRRLPRPAVPRQPDIAAMEIETHVLDKSDAASGEIWFDVEAGHVVHAEREGLACTTTLHVVPVPQIGVRTVEISKVLHVRSTLSWIELAKP